MPKLSQLGALAIAEPQQAREKILAALRSNNGNTTYSAQALGIQHRQLCRLISKLGLDPDLANLRRELGNNKGRGN